jgi:uncharacterized RDD family membrane protein YckC
MASSSAALTFAGRRYVPGRRPFALRHSLLEARALAGALDVAAVLGLALGAALALAAAAPLSLARAVELVSAPAFALALSYFYVCEARYGRTLGKRAFGLRVRDEHGAPAGLGALCLRTLMRPLDAFCLVGLLSAVVTGGRVGDWVAGTTVVFDAGIPLAPARRLSWRLAAFPSLLGAAALIAALAPQL